MLKPVIINTENSIWQTAGLQFTGEQWNDSEGRISILAFGFAMALAVDF
jgi:hypothetical protein